VTPPESVGAAVEPVSGPRVGEVTADNVYVRSGPSLNHYTICKLKAGDKVTVRSEKGEWLEITPPAGTFSLVSGDFIDTSDDRSGVLNAENVRVRAGSLLNDDKYTVQKVLAKGTTVKILGRNADGFVRIEPPEGATLWINRNYVAFGSGGPPHADASADSKRPADGGAVNAAPTPATPASDGAEKLARLDSVTTSTGFPPSAASVAELRRLEEMDDAVRAELKKPASERDLSRFVERYEAIAQQTSDETVHRYVQVRVDQIRHLIGVGDAVRGISHFNAEAEVRRREFLEGRVRIRETLPPIPSALDIQGELRTSALFPPGSTPRRYRLVDPSAPTERTIGYVEIPEGSNIEVGDFLGRYVGVRASAKRLQSGGVDPVPIFVAGELVLLNPATTTGGVADEDR
jgi:SH3-like domain-containing protein